MMNDAFSKAFNSADETTRSEVIALLTQSLFALTAIGQGLAMFGMAGCKLLFLLETGKTINTDEDGDGEQPTAPDVANQPA